MSGRFELSDADLDAAMAPTRDVMSGVVAYGLSRAGVSPADVACEAVTDALLSVGFSRFGPAREVVEAIVRQALNDAADAIREEGERVVSNGVPATYLSAYENAARIVRART